MKSKISLATLFCAALALSGCTSIRSNEPGLIPKPNPSSSNSRTVCMDPALRLGCRPN